MQEREDHAEAAAACRERPRRLRALAQLDLFARPAEPRAPEPTPDFVRGIAVDRSEMGCYLHIIRGADDPERSPRPKGGVRDKAPHLTLRRTTTVEGWKTQIERLLEDGRPRTFNAIGVELLDQTADTLLDSPVDHALWSLVDAGALEHTLTAPVYFRLFRAADPSVAETDAQTPDDQSPTENT
jgi:hypothetical protein